MKIYIKPHPTKEELQRAFRYDAESGRFYYFTRPANAVDISKPAGCITKSGYIQLSIKGVKYLLHRLVWIFHKGDIPDGMLIDHKDGNPSNCKIDNLQIADQFQNMQKARLRSDNISGETGVYFCSKRKKWIAQISCEHKMKYLGGYEDIEEAIEVRRLAAIDIHGQFAQLNFSFKDQAS